MLNVRYLTLLVLVTMLITGCVKKPVTPELTFGRYYYGYEITGNGAKNVVQVFDDGESTYLQLIPALKFEIASMQIKSSNTKVLRHEALGPLLKISGIHEQLFWDTAHSSVEIYRFQLSDLLPAT